VYGREVLKLTLKREEKNNLFQDTKEYVIGRACSTNKGYEEFV
jgi:hypothetical protein